MVPKMSPVSLAAARMQEMDWITQIVVSGATLCRAWVRATRVKQSMILAVGIVGRDATFMTVMFLRTLPSPMIVKRVAEGITGLEIKIVKKVNHKLFANHKENKAGNGYELI